MNDTEIREAAKVLFERRGEACIDGLRWILDGCNGSWPDVVNEALELTMPLDAMSANHQRAILRLLVPAALLAAREDAINAEAAAHGILEIDVGYQVTPGGQKSHHWVQPADVAAYIVERETAAREDERERSFEWQYKAAVKACMWMQDDKTLGLQDGDILTVEGVAALRKQRDDLRLEVKRQYDALHGMHGDYQQTWLEKDGRIAELEQLAAAWKEMANAHRDSALAFALGSKERADAAKKRLDVANKQLGIARGEAGREDSLRLAHQEWDAWKQQAIAAEAERDAAIKRAETAEGKLQKLLIAEYKRIKSDPESIALFKSEYLCNPVDFNSVIAAADALKGATLTGIDVKPDPLLIAADKAQRSIDHGERITDRAPKEGAKG